MKLINVVVAGATGYIGLELVKLLVRHPNVKIKHLCGTKTIGFKIHKFDEYLKKYKYLPTISKIDKINFKNIDVVFTALPNGEAQLIAKKIQNKSILIDLSGDFRLDDSKLYKKWYKINHKAKNLINKSIYSIPEITDNKIKNYKIISCPGCYPTSVQLPLIPLLRNKINPKDIIIDSKSGYSGAGKNLEKKFKHKNLYQSTFAYSTKNHRHISEIDQEILKYTGKKVKFTFNPHLLPTFRGILTSIYVETKKNISSNKLRSELSKFYKNDRFIKILRLNSELGSGNVLNTNNCEISICNTRIRNKVIIFSAIDNLVKGAAGQAIQNMNLIYKLPEFIGLR